jgi:pectate lyase
MRTHTTLLVSSLLIVAACSSPPAEDPPTPDSGAEDASSGADASSPGDASSPVEDAGPVDAGAPAAGCEAAATARGWDFCSGGPTQCSIVFGDGTGCQAACAALGLECTASFDDEPGACDYQRDLPPLGCAETGHQTDYCVCGGGVVVAPDAGVEEDAGGGEEDAGAEEDMGPSGDAPHEAILSELVGFGEGTTGGAGGPIVEVTTLADSGPGSLRAAAEAPGAAWIRFRVSGEIALSSDIQVASDKTIDGRGADVTVTGRGLFVQGGAGNVIITHMKIRDTSNDMIRFFDGGSRMWVHHCDLSNGGDGAFDATEGVTGVTVSYTHIFDHDKAMLVGAGSPDGDGASMRWTGHHNWYEDTVQRLPFIRFGLAHSYNNLIMWRSGTAMSVRLAPGQMLVENNVLMPQTNVGHKLININDGAAARLVGNLERPLSGDQIEYTEVSPGDVFDPADSYAYTAETADDALIAKIRAEAGWQDVPFPE